MRVLCVFGLKERRCAQCFFCPNKTPKTKTTKIAHSVITLIDVNREFQLLTISHCFTTLNHLLSLLRKSAVKLLELWYATTGFGAKYTSEFTSITTFAFRAPLELLCSWTFLKALLFILLPGRLGGSVLRCFGGFCGGIGG